MGLGSKETIFNKDKALNAVLLIAQSIQGSTIHHISKVLYFAERKHLANYGRTITGDAYIRMNFGPVPSTIYDIFKALRADGSGLLKEEAQGFFQVANNKQVTPVAEVNLDVFSDSEIDCLEESIEENADLGFSTRSDKSHDDAWKSASPNGKMDLKKIAIAGGADERMLNYIKELADYKFLSR